MRISSPIGVKTWVCVGMLALAIGCETSATPTPIIVEKEVVREVPVTRVVEVEKVVEVPVTVVVEKEVAVTREVPIIREVPVTAFVEREVVVTRVVEVTASPTFTLIPSKATATPAMPQGLFSKTIGIYRSNSSALAYGFREGIDVDAIEPESFSSLSAMYRGVIYMPPTVSYGYGTEAIGQLTQLSRFIEEGGRAVIFIGDCRDEFADRLQNEFGFRCASAGTKIGWEALKGEWLTPLWQGLSVGSDTATIQLVPGPSSQYECRTLTMGDLEFCGSLTGRFGDGEVIFVLAGRYKGQYAPSYMFETDHIDEYDNLQAYINTLRWLVEG